MGFILVLISAGGFSIKSILVKLAYLYPVSPITVLTLRMCIAALTFSLVLFVKLKKSGRRLGFTARDWRLVMLLGFLCYYLCSFLEFSGLTYVSAGLGRMILFLYPTMVVIIAAAVHRRPIGRFTILALGLCYGGIALIIGPDLGHQKNIWLGSVFLFASALVYAIYLTILDQLLRRVHPMSFAAMVMCMSTPFLLIHFAATQPLSDILVPLPVLLLTIVMALVSTVLPTYALASGIALIGSAKAAMISMVGPGLTLLLGFLILDEHMVPVQLLGVLLVLIGVWRVGRA